MLRTTVTCHFSTPQLPRVLRAWCALYLLIWKYASRHSDLPLLRTSTSKSAPSMVCFVFLVLRIRLAPQWPAIFPHPNFQKCSEHGVFCISWFEIRLAPQWPAIFPRPNFQKCSEHGVLCISWFENMFRPTVTCHSSAPQLPKVLRAWCALYFLVWKYASHHSDLPFFHAPTSKSAKVLRTWCVLNFLVIWKYASLHSDLPFFHTPTSKSAPSMVCFVFLYLKIRFAPQWPAIFPHPNFQKCSEHGVLCISCFESTFRTTVTCHFSTPQLPKVLKCSRTWCVLYFLIWKHASRHNDLPFFHAPTSKSAPIMVCFVFLDLKTCFAPQWPPIFSTPQLPKVLRAWCALYLLIWKYASRHSDLPFFHTLTSKSAPSMVCFVFLVLKICFAPQWPAIFPHPNFQKCSEHGVLCISWFENMLRATMTYTIFPRPNFQKCSEHGVFCISWFENTLRTTVTCHFSTPQLPKLLRAWCVLFFLFWKYASHHNDLPFFHAPTSKLLRAWYALYFLFWKYASHHSDLPFFHAPTSKTAPSMVCFVFFVLKIRFAPQWPAIFPRPNFQEWSDHGMLCIFCFENTLRATVTCHFSTPQLPKLLRAWCALYFLFWKYASRHSDLPFFHTPTSKSASIMVCFVFLVLKIRFAPQWPAIFPRPNFQKCSQHGVLCISCFENTFRTTVTCHFSTPQLPRVLRAWSCFVSLVLKIRFAPQWPAIFPRPNFQKCSEHGVLCISWFENTLRTTVTCHVSTPQLPRVLRAWCALYFLFWKYASHHSDLPFFHAPTSKSVPSMVCFVSLDLKIRFAPQWPAIFHAPTSKSAPSMVCFVSLVLKIRFAPQWPAIFPRPNFQECSEHGELCISCFENTLRTTVTCHFSTPQLPKVLRAWCALYFLFWKYASHHSDLPFFHAPTSKSAPSMVCFVSLDLKIRFAPQWPAIFPRPNFQECSEHGELCISCFENTLRTTVTCHFSTPQLPKLLRAWCVFYILTWECFSRHRSVPFFDIGPSKGGPIRGVLHILTLKTCFAPQRRAIFHFSSSHRARRFSEPTFRPSQPTNHWKNIACRNFPSASRTCIFFLVLFSYTLLFSAFCLSILSEVWLLNFVW